MTDQSIEQIAREIAAKVCHENGLVNAPHDLLDGAGDESVWFLIARLALLEGMKLQRERCAKLVEGWNDKTADGNTFLIAAAIRSAMP